MDQLGEVPFIMKNGWRQKTLGNSRIFSAIMHKETLEYYLSHCGEGNIVRKVIYASHVALRN